MRKLVCICVWSLLLTPSVAAAYVSSEGHEYSSTCNESGMVLTSVNPVSRFIEQGADSHVISGKEKIYLGIRCDAYNKALGKGEWGWANGGFWIEFASGRVSFPRQEVYCKENEPQPFDMECHK